MRSTRTFPLFARSFSFLALSFFLLTAYAQNCNDKGTILDGTNTILNPDGNGFFSSSGVKYSQTTEEYTEFETPSGFGVGGANRSWTPITGSEPTGLADAGDVAAGGNCGNTDINTDTNGGNDYAYYSIIDPDNTADNGDEKMAFAIRIADQISGAFTFSFLMDADNNCGSDPNAVCGNPCFEFEIQLNTQQGEVNVIDIDGCNGTADCDALNAAGTPNGTDAFICEDCTGTDEALQVCAGSSECGGSNPVFWVFYVNFSDLPGLSSTDNFSIVPATTTSPNSVIYKNTNVSDFGGIGDPENAGECDCLAKCSGSSCSDCIQDCAFECAVEIGNNVSFPVEFGSFDGSWENKDAHLTWTTLSELNNSHFSIEHSSDGIAFDEIGTIQGMGTTMLRQSYTFVDANVQTAVNFYRIKQVDFNGTYSYSNMIRLTTDSFGPTAELLGNPVREMARLKLNHIPREGLMIQLQSLTGQTILLNQISASEGEVVHNIPVQQLTNGMYFLTIRKRGGKLIQTHKLMKM